jgi:hypothetical protein
VEVLAEAARMGAGQGMVAAMVRTLWRCSGGRPLVRRGIPIEIN